MKNAIYHNTDYVIFFVLLCGEVKQLNVFIMRQYSVTIKVFSGSVPFTKDITVIASDLRDLDAKLNSHADQNDIVFDIVFIHVFENHDYKPLPF